MAKRYQPEDLRIRDLIAVLAGRPGQSYETVAARIGVTDRTLRSKRTRPETFTLLELRRLRALAEANGLTFDIL